MTNDRRVSREGDHSQTFGAIAFREITGMQLHYPTPDFLDYGLQCLEMPAILIRLRVDLRAEVLDEARHVH